MPHSSKALHFALAAVLLLGATACGQAVDPAYVDVPKSSPTGSSASSSSSGSSAASSTSSTSGAASSGGSSSSSSGAAPMPSSPCAVDAAFAATSASFPFPTPKKLSLALSSLSYDPTAQPVTIVLLADPKRGVPTMLATATETTAQGLLVIPAGQSPTRGAATLDPLGFASKAPLTVSYLRFAGKNGPIDLQIADAIVTSKQQSSCMAAWIQIDAGIPDTQAAMMIPDAEGGEVPLSELVDAQPNKQGPMSYPVRALFLAQTVSFDFASVK